jgi:hypothetical protein
MLKSKSVNLISKKDDYNFYIQPKNDEIVDEPLLQSPLKFSHLSKTCLATEPKPYFKHAGLKEDNNMGGLASLLSNFEITKLFEDLK